MLKLADRDDGLASPPGGDLGSGVKEDSAELRELRRRNKLLEQEPRAAVRDATTAKLPLQRWQDPGMSSGAPPRITVLGAGVIGLSVAHELSAVAVVTVLADRPAERSVSAVAAAVWFPYASGAGPVDDWLSRSYARFSAIADDPAAGVDLRPGTVVERAPDADRSWTAAVPAWRPARLSELPVGAAGGVRATVPVIAVAHYLPWLRARCVARGVGFVEGSASSMDELAAGADLVVVAAGIGAAGLLQDATVFPVRGQVVRLANPGLTSWIIDDADHGLTYVVPRRDDIVCGGTAEVGSYDEELDPSTEAAILRRATALVPELAGLPVLSRAAGLRPARPQVRLETVTGHPVPVIACYGHGGAGVTLSWGCAEAVASLVGVP